MIRSYLAASCLAFKSRPDDVSCRAHPRLTRQGCSYGRDALSVRSLSAKANTMETPATQFNVESNDMVVERRGGQGVRVARPISLACLCVSSEASFADDRASPR
jgi:hypothetical protein